MLWRVVFVSAVVVVVSALPRSGHNKTSSVIDQIISEGYPAELHHVITVDGYILGMHRIPHGKAGPRVGRRPIVFLMHGIMGASSSFIFLGQEYGIAYNLADAGYDVWMGNCRGNVYSRKHVSLNPDDPRQKGDFFDFSYEEIALIDVPAMVEYALAVTGEQKAHYVGYSQGGTTFLVLNSMRPEYNDKFVSAHLLAGLGYTNHFPNAELQEMARQTDAFYAVGRGQGRVDISSFDELPINLLNPGYRATDNCVRDVQQYEGVGFNEVFGVTNDEGLDEGGSSLKQFAHLLQNIRDRSFRRWDNGLLTNLRIYGTTSPPSYDLSLITVPTTMYYTVNDAFLGEQDVLAMANAMPRAQARKIARETFTHGDFVQAADTRELVTQYVIAGLNLAERLVAERVHRLRTYDVKTGGKWFHKCFQRGRYIPIFTKFKQPIRFRVL